MTVININSKKHKKILFTIEDIIDDMIHRGNLIKEKLNFYRSNVTGEKEIDDLQKQVKEMLPIDNQEILLAHGLAEFYEEQAQFIRETGDLSYDAIRDLLHKITREILETEKEFIKAIACDYENNLEEEYKKK